MFGYLVLTLGGLLFGAMAYRYDRQEREPWWMLVAAVLAGALTMWGAFALELLFQAAASSDRGLLHSLLAGTLEELAKLIVPVGVLLGVRRYFNDPMDGLIYGSLAGLGAALFEGAWWQWFAPINEDAGLIAAHGPNAMRLILHTIWGGIAAFSLGFIVMKRPWRQPLLRSVALVMLIHFAWDYFIAFVPQHNETNWHRLLAALLVGISVVWYGLLVLKANKWSRAMHAPPRKQRLAVRVLKALITRRFK